MNLSKLSYSFHELVRLLTHPHTQGAFSFRSAVRKLMFLIHYLRYCCIREVLCKEVCLFKAKVISWFCLFTLELLRLCFWFCVCLFLNQSSTVVDLYFWVCDIFLLLITYVIFSFPKGWHSKSELRYTYVNSGGANLISSIANYFLKYFAQPFHWIQSCINAEASWHLLIAAFFNITSICCLLGLWSHSSLNFTDEWP